MNIEYTHVNNKAIIKDEKGNTKIMPYYDNLKKVLIQENSIELMEDEMAKVLKAFNYYKDKDFKYIPLATLILSLTSYFVIPGVFKAIGAPEDWLNEMGRFCTNYDALRYSFAMIGIPAGALIDYEKLSDCNKNKKTKNGAIVEKELLEKRINYEKKLLEQLQNDKTNSNIQEENDYEIIKIDNDTIYKQIKFLYDFYYTLGHEEKKLYRNYLKGTLNKYYSGNNLEVATNYFEEKGPVLAKKYNKK